MYDCTHVHEIMIVGTECRREMSTLPSATDTFAALRIQTLFSRFSHVPTTILPHAT